MTTKSFFAAALCCMGLSFATEASANSWRVNYDSRANADFQDLNAAMADERVADGDTLYMDKGCTISTMQTITKAVTIIGPGYFIGENDADEAYFSNYLVLTAAKTKITGLHTSGIELQNDNIIIERCRVTGIIYANTTNHTTDKVSIRQCYINNNAGVCINGSNSTGWEIANNIIYHINGDAGTNIYYSITSLQNAYIDHNAIHHVNYGRNSNYSYIFMNVEKSTITNNIAYNMSSYSYYTTNCFGNGYDLNSGNKISHNVFSGTNYSSNGFPNNKGNMENLSVYDQWPGDYYRDDHYTLSENSIAKGYAEDGSDCGPFAGAYPYVLSGYPLYVPRFESIKIPSQPDENGKLNIHMVIKNQNK